jgi:ABC-type multidrug transport system fused ATPase/permease subunit
MSLDLLSARDRRVLIVVTFAQSSLAILDLIGVALIGLVAAMSTALMGGRVPNSVTSLLGTVGLETANPTNLALALALAAAVLLVFKSLASFFITKRIYSFLAKRQAQVSSDLAERFLSRPLLEVTTPTTQETAYALTSGVNAAVLGVLGSAVVLVSESVLLVVLAIGLAFVDLVVCIFTIVFFVLVALAVHRALASRARRLGARTGKAEIASTASVQEAILTYRELVVSGRREFYVDKFRGLRTTASSAQAGIQVVNMVPKYVFEISLVIGGGLLAASQFLTKDSVAAVAVIAVYLAAASRIMPSMLRLQSSLIVIRSSSGIAESTYEMVERLEVWPILEHGSTHARVRIDDFAGFDSTLDIINVSFAFPGESESALDGVTLRVPPGSSLALVGPTGAGKSTLVDIAMGVVRPGTGSVKISGVDPAAAIQQWPGAIACVPQAVHIVEGTIRMNVALGLPPDAVEDADVWEALEKAQLGHFLETQREGLDTVVGERGVRLSGGQRQRLGLARALYSKPRLLFLDEATSALDAETERIVSEAIRSLSGHVSVVVIAHRLATVREMDQVGYLEDGRLKALGPFDVVRQAVPNFERQATLLGL